MSDTAVIKNCTASQNGGAVCVAGGNAHMENGDIEFCTAAVNGGAVAVSNGNFNISGGTIHTVGANGNGGAVSVSGSGSVTMSNTAVIKNTTTQGNGGAVSVSGGSFTMSGGTIGGTDTEKCTASQNGGGVAVDGGTFTMNDGTMQNCTATGNGGSVFVSGGTASVSGGSLSYCSAVNGGAVYVFVNDNSQDSFTMSGTASITGCTASKNGGAVCVAGGSAGMSGGSISSCNATGNGGAVSVTGGDFNMTAGTIQSSVSGNFGGAVYVEDGNLDIFSGTVTQNKALDGGAVCVLEGNVTIGKEGCDGTENNHSHPITTGNSATRYGGAFSVSGGTLDIYCGQVTGNTAANYPNTASIYQNGGSITIHNGVDENSISSSEITIIGANTGYEDKRRTSFWVTLYPTPDTPDSQVYKFQVVNPPQNSLKLSETLIPAFSWEIIGGKPDDGYIIGWSTSKDTTKDNRNSQNFIPEDSKVLLSDDVTYYAVWGNSQDLGTYTVTIPAVVNINTDGTSSTHQISVDNFFIPAIVGTLSVILSDYDGKLDDGYGHPLSYSLYDNKKQQLTNGTSAASFTYYASAAQSISAKITETPDYAGTYTDTVTFTVNYQVAEYGDNCFTGDAS